MFWAFTLKCMLLSRCLTVDSFPNTIYILKDKFWYSFERSCKVLMEECLRFWLFVTGTIWLQQCKLITWKVAVWMLKKLLLCMRVINSFWEPNRSLSCWKSHMYVNSLRLYLSWSFILDLEVDWIWPTLHFYFAFSKY